MQTSIFIKVIFSAMFGRARIFWKIPQLFQTIVNIVTRLICRQIRFSDSILSINKNFCFCRIWIFQPSIRIFYLQIDNILCIIFKYILFIIIIFKICTILNIIIFKKHPSLNNYSESITISKLKISNFNLYNICIPYNSYIKANHCLIKKLNIHQNIIKN